MIYDLYFDKGDISTDSVPTSEIESAVPDRITDTVIGQEPVTEVDTAITFLDSYVDNSGNLVVKIDTAADHLIPPEEGFVVDTISGSVMDTLLDRNAVFADYAQNLKEAEYVPTVLTDSYEKSDAVMSLTQEQKDYILNNFNVYDISTVKSGAIADDSIVHAEKPIGLEVRFDEDITRSFRDELQKRLPFDGNVSTTRQSSSVDIITIKYDDSLSEYMHWFSGRGDRFDELHELSVILNDLLQDGNKVEFNEMNEGSLIYKVREGGYERPW